MKYVRILTKDYYDRPEFYPFMPRSIFNLLEEAELKGAIYGQEIAVDVPEEEFLLMIRNFDEHKNKLTNGSKNNQTTGPRNSK